MAHTAGTRLSVRGGGHPIPIRAFPSGRGNLEPLDTYDQLSDTLTYLQGHHLTNRNQHPESQQLVLWSRFSRSVRNVLFSISAPFDGMPNSASWQEEISRTHMQPAGPLKFIVWAPLTPSKGLELSHNRSFTSRTVIFATVYHHILTVASPSKPSRKPIPNANIIKERLLIAAEA